MISLNAAPCLFSSGLLKFSIRCHVGSRMYLKDWTMLVSDCAVGGPLFNSNSEWRRELLGSWLTSSLGRTASELSGESETRVGCRLVQPGAVCVRRAVAAISPERGV